MNGERPRVGEGYGGPNPWAPASANTLGCRSRRPVAAAALRGTRPVGRAPATAGTLSGIARS